ncbi:MAG: pseudouridine synthase [Polyangiaceae bacterium]
MTTSANRERAVVTLTLLHRDESLAVFDKPSGLLVHRGWGDDPITATDLAREMLGGEVSPAHRIDRATSGVLVFARGREAAQALARMFEEGAVDKTYLALVRGDPPDEGVIDHPIPRREGGPRVPATTHFRVRARGRDVAPEDLPPDIRRVSLVEAHPRTGRLHQVRRHLKHLSHPLIGDANYGKGALNRMFADAIGLRRLALHALTLRLMHPLTGEAMRFTARVPEDLAGPLARLGIMVHDGS